MTAVQTTTDEMPGLAEMLVERERLGLNTYDEWWEGVYRTVTGPTLEHGRLLNKLARLLDPLAEAEGLYTAAPLNLGVDKVDVRVPDLGAYHPNTPRTSPAFLQTALLVVEVLSPSEKAGEKMDFFRRWDVEEYLEISLAHGTVELYVNRSDGWEMAEVSSILRFGVSTRTVVDLESGLAIDARDFKPR